VTIRSGSAVLAVAPVSGSAALVTLLGLHAGRHPLVATYTGDAATPGGTSPAGLLTVRKGRTRTTATPVAGPGGAVKVRIQVKAVSPARGPVTGKVVIVSGSVKKTVTLRNGKATATLKLGPGRRTITVTYRGSADFTRSVRKATATVT
jgi:hypothetical protein